MGWEKKIYYILKSIKNVQLFLGLQVYSMQPIFTATCTITSCAKKLFIRYFFSGFLLAQSLAYGPDS